MKSDETPDAPALWEPSSFPATPPRRRWPAILAAGLVSVGERWLYREALARSKCFAVGEEEPLTEDVGHTLVSGERSVAFTSLAASNVVCVLDAASRDRDAVELADDVQDLHRFGGGFVAVTNSLIVVIDEATRRAIAEIPLRESGGARIIRSAADRLFLATSTENAVRIETCARARGVVETVLELPFAGDFSPDLSIDPLGRFVVQRERDGARVVVWDLASGRRLAYEGHSDLLCFDASGHFVVDEEWISEDEQRVSGGEVSLRPDRCTYDRRWTVRICGEEVSSRPMDIPGRGWILATAAGFALLEPSTGRVVASARTDGAREWATTRDGRVACIDGDSVFEWHLDDS